MSDDNITPLPVRRAPAARPPAPSLPVLTVADASYAALQAEQRQREWNQFIAAGAAYGAAVDTADAFQAMAGAPPGVRDRLRRLAAHVEAEFRAAHDLYARLRRS